MANLIVRNIDATIVQALKMRASQHVSVQKQSIAKFWNKYCSNLSESLLQKS
jgi:hypothetical protein